ncbi:Phosphatidylinositol 4-kinase gamma 1 [Dichanthelium oligosanthes]|uniref:1-phosphatidylinositol 4-kinase n=1 Tax=Dichanthelium oligosanthes TaxID=888268 RepID=A0A1E5ULF5_9POAL|nr:Phosphatidylinositol 4-kinase gamma 1 [Dichanthelium oligosanthes]
MAIIAVGHFHDLEPPDVRGRHCRLHSVAQLDSPLLDRDHREHSDAAAGAGHTGLSPRRRSQSSPCFTTISPAGGEHADRSENKMPRVEIVAGRHARGVRELIAEAAAAIASGTRLVPARSGLGGALLLNGSRAGEHVAVIKPLDDTSTAGSLANGGYESKAVLREVAAFLLDHDGFASVEPTALIKISRPAMPTTMASIQRFVSHEYDAGELGPSRFSVASVHRVGILDVRLLNIDRHAGNILVKNPPSSQRAHGSASTPPPLDLVPIDHGLCLPEQLDDPYFEWLHWPQSSLPFSDDEQAYIASLDPFKDAETLRAELPSLKEPAIRMLTLCTIFLQRAAAAGLCLADIGDMMTREFTAQEEPGLSTLEALCKHAHDSVLPPRPPSLPCPPPDGDGVDEGTTSSGGRKHVSFGDLSFAEWAAFLDMFEQLLAAALEAKKRAAPGTTTMAS